MNKIFKLKEHKTNVKTEVMAGLKTFFTMSYILAVNSSLLSATNQLTFSSVFFATAISAAFACLVMGFYANLPFALAPGMGVNAFFAFNIVLGSGYSANEALALTFISGVVFFIISVTGIRQSIVRSIPQELRYAIGAGIGFFIAFLGLKSAGIIVADPATFVTLAKLTTPSVVLSIFGIVLAIILLIKRVHAAVFFSMVVCLVIGLIAGILGVANMPQLPVTILSVNLDTSLIGAFLGGFSTLFNKPILVTLISIFTLLFMDFFDTTGTLIAVSNNLGISDKNGEFEGMDKAIATDAIGTIFGSFVGTSTVTTFVESTAGVAVGGKTGLTSVVVGICFLISMFFSPFFAIFTSAIVSPALIVVGILMASQLTNIDFKKVEVSAPAFITILMMILTFSIGDGIALGFIVYTFISIFKNKGKNLNLTVYILTIIFIIRFIV